MTDHLSALRLFVQVAHRRSFSAAARDLDIPQPTASRLISQLEQQIGKRLFNRTTRTVALTRVGEDFLARIEPILADLDEAEHAVRGAERLPGLLRVGLSSLAVRAVAPALPRFVEQHPELKVELIMEENRRHAFAERVDLALRFGVIQDSGAIIHHLGAWPSIVAASPDYLAKAPPLAVPADIENHTVIVGPGQMERPWRFTNAERTLVVRPFPRLSVSAHEVGIALALAGMGILGTTIGACRRELREGSLVRVLPDWSLGRVELNAVLTPGQTVKPSARALLDFLVAELSADPD